MSLMEKTNLHKNTENIDIEYGFNQTYNVDENFYSELLSHYCLTVSFLIDNYWLNRRMGIDS